MKAVDMPMACASARCVIPFRFISAINAAFRKPGPRSLAGNSSDHPISN